MSGEFRESLLWKDQGKELPPQTRQLFLELKDKIAHESGLHPYSKRVCKYSERVCNALYNELGALPGIGKAKSIAFVYTSSQNDQDILVELAIRLRSWPQRPISTVYDHYWLWALNRLDHEPARLLDILAPTALRRYAFELPWDSPGPKKALQKLFTREDVHALREWRASWRN